jgi:hypothetical protein
MPYVILNETPSFAAITVVAPGVRFNALAIFVLPFLSFAIDFSKRKSSLLHARRTRFFIFLAIVAPLCERPSYHSQSIWQHEARIAAANASMSASHVGELGLAFA